MDFYLRPIIEHHFMCKFWIYVLGTEVSVTNITPTSTSAAMLADFRIAFQTSRVLCSHRDDAADKGVPNHKCHVYVRSSQNRE